MQLFKLFIIFVIIMGMVLLKRPLWQAILASVIAVPILFGIPVTDALVISGRSLYEKDTIILVVNFLLVTFLQREMENRKLLERAELALQRLSGSRQLVCMISTVIIGFLPSAGAVNICGKIVDDMTGDDLPASEKAFIASYYRHIPESFSPTYNSVILTLSITGLATGSFVLCMIPLVLVLLCLGYLFYLIKIGNGSVETQHKYDRREEYKQLLFCFWPLAACILIVSFFDVSIMAVLAGIILITIPLYRLTFSEIINFAKSSFEKRIIFNIIILMIFKNLLTSTGVMEEVTSMLGKSSVPLFISLGFLMVFGTLISGANTMIVLIIPMALSAMPEAGVSLVVFLVALSYIAMQISPTHVCLAVITEYSKVSWADLVAKTIPVAVVFIVIVHLYYLLLTSLGL